MVSLSINFMSIKFTRTCKVMLCSLLLTVLSCSALQAASASDDPLPMTRTPALADLWCEVYSIPQTTYPEIVININCGEVSTTEEKSEFTPLLDKEVQVVEGDLEYKMKKQWGRPTASAVIFLVIGGIIGKYLL